MRDRLLGLPIQDRDHVVVGATPEELLEKGFTPVGRDFPVFIHPDSHEEYALARTERKTAPGYAGFSFHAAPGVTLEQDLARRDLTINAMAEDEHGRVIDPYDGQADLARRVLRHVGPAFAEDPVRILRLARFAARFYQFSVAPQTMELMKAMVAAGEVDALVAERIWQECARGLAEDHPARMLEVLTECGALARIAPEIRVATSWPLLDEAARRQSRLEVRFAVWMQEAALGPAALLDLCARWRVPGECNDLATLGVTYGTRLTHAVGASDSELLDLLERCDAFRRAPRFALLLEALSVVAGSEQAASALEQAATVARAVDGAAIAARVGRGGDIGAAIHAERLAALAGRQTRS